MSPPQDRFIGQLVEGCRIESLLGKGGMGVVYKGYDTSLRRPVAVKILLEGALDDSDAVKRFEREARILAELNHPNIAQIYRIGHHEGIPFYSMEYIEGRSLDNFLAAETRLSGTRCVKYMIQAAQGLKAAADQNVTHRDIKPANIMIAESGLLKIVDFGIAKAVTEDTFRTATGTIMGTPRYMSPEQGKGGEIDLRSDIYSLGATFYHMVCGRPPFDADNAFALIMKHITEPAPPIPEFNANVPETLCGIIYTMLEKEPGKRFQDYTALIKALESIFEKPETTRPHGPPTAVRLAPKDEKSKAEENARQLKLILVGLTAAVIVLLGMLMLGPSKEDSGSKEIRKSGEPTTKDEGGKGGGGMVEIFKQLKDAQGALKK